MPEAGPESTIKIGSVVYVPINYIQINFYLLLIISLLLFVDPGSPARRVPVINN